MKRIASVMAAVLALAALAASSGCSRTQGDIGNKNIRPNAVRQQDIDRGHRHQITGMHGNSKLQMDEKIAEKLAAMPEIESAFVTLGDRNAYVAVMQERAGKGGSQSAELGDAVKNKIADRVKSMAPSIENVYVSANPDFQSRMEHYAAEARNGHPIQGFVAEFNAMVERMFPERAGNRTTDGNRDGMGGNGGMNRLDDMDGMNGMNGMDNRGGMNR